MLEVHHDDRYRHIFHIAMQPKVQTTSSADTETEYYFFFSFIYTNLKGLCAK